MVSSDKLARLYEEIGNPLSWHWRVHQSGIKNKLLSSWKGIRSFISSEQQHVSEVLAELARTRQDDAFRNLWTELQRLEREFQSQPQEEYQEAAKTVDRTMLDFNRVARLRKQRRWLLLMGAIGVGDVFFELAGGKGIIRITGDAIVRRTESARLKALSKQELVNEMLSIPRHGFAPKAPSFTLSPKFPTIKHEHAKILVPAIKDILDHFDTPSNMTIKSVMSQVGLKQDTSGNSQKLLLPTSDKETVIVVSDFHSVSKMPSDNTIYTNPSIREHSGWTFIGGGTVVVYSESSDIAVSLWSTSSNPMTLTVPSFSTRHKSGSFVRFTTNTSLFNFDCERSEQWV